jgi:hypothetical protein
MYDSVDLTLRKQQAPGIKLIDQTSRYFDIQGEHRYDNGNISLSGNLGGLKLLVSDEKVKIGNGSLCKYYLGDNFRTMTRGDTKRAIEQLSDTLHLPINNADVTRIDIAQNLIMNHPPEAYFNHLGELSRCNRLPQPNGIYYQNGKQQIIFYNKIKEQKNKKQPIPEPYKDRNVLRYELRYKERLREVFEKDRVTGSDLYNEPFYIRLIDNWQSNYNNIHKIKLIEIDFSNMHTKKELFLIALADTISRQGGELLFLEQINDAAKRGEMTAKQKFDIRNAVREACSLSLNTKESELIAELNKKVTEAVKYYR